MQKTEIRYSHNELMKMIADVSKEFSADIKKAEQTLGLAKSEDESEKKDEPKDKEEPKKMESESKEDKGVKDQNQQDSSKEDKGEKPESKEERVEEDKMEAKKPSDDAHGEAQDHGYDDEDMAHMHSMYSSMSKAELKAHHDCLRKCMDGMAMSEQGMAKGEMGDAAKDAEGYRPNGGPKDGQSESEGKGPAASDEQALEKSEKFATEISLLKAELEAQKAKNAEEKKNLEAALSNFLTKFVEKTVPAGKAITSLDIIAKTEKFNAEKPLSKNEVLAKLAAKAKDPTLQKSDRDAINRYCLGSTNYETISHLL